jgi:hypothetical protein
MAPLGFRDVSFRMIPPPATLGQRPGARAKPRPKDRVATLPGIRFFWRATALPEPVSPFPQPT